MGLHNSRVSGDAELRHDELQRHRLFRIHRGRRLHRTPTTWKASLGKFAPGPTVFTVPYTTRDF